MHQQYQVLQPFVTAGVTALVRSRLLEGGRFFDGHRLKPGLKRADVKLALLLVKIANPHEILTAEERTLLTGGQRQNSAKQ